MARQYRRPKCKYRLEDASLGPVLDSLRFTCREAHFFYEGWDDWGVVCEKNGVAMLIRREGYGSTYAEPFLLMEERLVRVEMDGKVVWRKRSVLEEMSRENEPVPAIEEPPEEEEEEGE